MEMQEMRRYFDQGQIRLDVGPNGYDVARYDLLPAATWSRTSLISSAPVPALKPATTSANGIASHHRACSTWKLLPQAST